MNGPVSLIVGLAVSCSMTAAGWAATPVGAPEPGRLEARVAVVTSDLSVKPVPKQRFLIQPQEGTAAGAEGAQPIMIATGFDGALARELPPGRYRVRSEAPVVVDGKSITWDVPFEIKPGETMKLELSNDNATIEGPPGGAAPARDLDAGALYERYRQGVFKIIADGGHGSGFLVDGEGLIVTNHHVIDGATYLAAKLDDQHKHIAVVIADDPNHDVAVLRVHPDTVRGRPVLPLAEDRPDKAPVSVGERVAAIGSPLTTEGILTEGVVSKIQEDKIYSDVNINPGNSGGPLLDRVGEVIGINTFEIGAERGPGLSGITRIHLAGAILATARDKLKSAPPPSSRSLPVESTYRFDPAAIKKEAMAHERKAEDFQLTAGKLDVIIVTPVLAASQVLRADREAAEAHNKRRKDKDAETAGTSESSGEQFYAWQKDDENFRPVVRVRALPKVKMSFGSAFKMGMTGRGGKFQFKSDFDRMELSRGTEVVEPILPGRIKEVVNVTGPGGSLKDIGYWGLYEYPPEAFRPGADLVLRIWEQGVAEPYVVNLSPELLTKIREDFRLYLDTAPPAGS